MSLAKSDHMHWEPRPSIRICRRLISCKSSPNGVKEILTFASTIDGRNDEVVLGDGSEALDLDCFDGRVSRAVVHNEVLPESSRIKKGSSDHEFDSVFCRLDHGTYPILAPIIQCESEDVGWAQPLKKEAIEVAKRLNLEEQVSLLAGEDFWRTVAIPLKGAAFFPAGVSLGSTWNVDLVQSIGKHLGNETKARGAHVLLAPTVGLHRSVRGGRNFESFSEDPLLSGKMAASYIRGVQSQGVSATIKHFVANEQETSRMTINTRVLERPLRELYLRPFEIAIRESNPWALMTSYNMINGVHADMHHDLLQGVLRKEWNYQGLIMSDWKGVNSTVPSIAAGCDLEMPGPAKWRAGKTMKAIECGHLRKEEIFRSAVNVIHLALQTKDLDIQKDPEERRDDREETRKLIREAGHEGLVLLKNNGVLPLDREIKTIALIGPHAKAANAGGGGSASLQPYYTTNPYNSIHDRLRSTKIEYARGCNINKWVPLASRFHCTTPSGMPGIQLDWFRGTDFEGPCYHSEIKQTTELYLWDSTPSKIGPAYSFRASFSITPSASGSHSVGFNSVGPGRLLVDEQLCIDNWNWTEIGQAMYDASVEVTKRIELKANKPVHFLIEGTSELRPGFKITEPSATYGYGGCRIGLEHGDSHDPDLGERLLREAVKVARKADAAIIFVGRDAEWESEGYDHQHMDLPYKGNQDRLVEAVAQVNPCSIVVNQSGTPVTMDWADKVPAIIQAWYQGQEAGNALADVLVGDANPSGKLPTTFPKRIEDSPAFHNFGGENELLNYGEGLAMGYRHYEKSKVEPRFAFGHGLSYTTFKYKDIQLNETTLTKDGSVLVTVTIENTGAREGSEIVQGYISALKSRLPRPEKELQAFTKLTLAPGQSEKANLKFDKYSVGYYDTSYKAWIAEKGTFNVLVGPSSADVR
ncbi:MAG: hypothetical protein LQ342_007668 [Letrouitia transgressa]|nr:MAG: hypothetical protein LQ342_007668 [Letrouitia transgressa]